MDQLPWYARVRIFLSSHVHLHWLTFWCLAGHDNPSIFCTVGDTNLLLDFNIFDHAGPYDGVLITTFC